MNEYLEQYKVAGRISGINFDKKEKEYKIWVGGCAIGRHKTLEGARKLLAVYIESWLRMSIAGHQQKLNELSEELRSLVLHPARLLHFVTAYAAK